MQIAICGCLLQNNYLENKKVNRDEHLASLTNQTEVPIFLSQRNADKFCFTIDVIFIDELSFIVNSRVEVTYASLLCEMPCQEGDERSKIYHYEEW